MKPKPKKPPRNNTRLPNRIQRSALAPARADLFYRIALPLGNLTINSYNSDEEGKSANDVYMLGALAVGALA